MTFCSKLIQYSRLSIFILLQLTILHADNYSIDIPAEGYVDIGNVLNFTYNDQLSIAYWFKVDSDE